MTKTTAGEKIIDAKKAIQKLDRIAIQILEENYNSKELIIIGIANKGYQLAELIVDRLKFMGEIPIILTSIKIDKRNPISQPIELGHPEMSFKGKSIIVIDDVGNTGRTMFYALQPIAKSLPKKIQVAVLVDRMHKSFPIHADFVGLELSTTLNEEVIVEFDEKGEVEGAYLF
jgi:pyrimidine operon attenuation protein/uracil phosphoribosyltransferase